MRRWLGFVMIVLTCIVPVGLGTVAAKPIPRYRETLKIPPEVASASSVMELTAFLDSRDEATRIAAARRIGQLGSQEGVGILADRFLREPYKAAIDSPPHLKLEIIEALGKIGGEQARAFLLDTFSRYWAQGPKAHRYVWEDGDYSSVVPAILEALYVWKDDRDILDLWDKVSATERNIPNWVTQQKAHELLLRADVARQGRTVLAQCVPYLAEMLTGRGAGRNEDWVQGKEGVKTQEALKNGAIVDILKKYGSPALPHIDQEINRYNSQPLTPTASGRLDALVFVRDWIQGDSFVGVELPDDAPNHVLDYVLSHEFHQDPAVRFPCLWPRGGVPPSLLALANRRKLAFQSTIITHGS